MVPPSISIIPPPLDDEQLAVEPCSPFAHIRSPVDDNPDTFRPRLLTPPPTNMHCKKPLSPLRPIDSMPTYGKGLERERFEALLKSSRERNTMVGGKKDSGLFRQLCQKTHKNKQSERRALFLSKVLAPPSPTAISMPKTPPESPSIFHYSLPSPGLVSPLALFESLNEPSPAGECPFTCQPWVEQVDFRRPTQKAEEKKDIRPTNNMPSLAEISARLGGHLASAEHGIRFPVILAQHRNTERPKLNFRGRLQMIKAAHLDIPPASPTIETDLEITTILVPHSAAISPVQLSESNLHALDSRARLSHDMLSTLRRRVQVLSDYGHNGHDEDVGDAKSTRRHSAPAEMTSHHRLGFEHPVLSMPGGF